MLASQTAIQENPHTPQARDAHAPAPAERRNPRSAADQCRIVDLLQVALWLAIVTGGLESCYWLYKQQIEGTLIFLHPGYFWLSPLAQILIFALPALILAIGGKLCRWSNSGPYAVAILSFIGWINCLYLFIPGLHDWAIFMLGIGLASVVGRVFRRYRQISLRVVRLSVGGLGAAVFFAAVLQISLARQSGTISRASPTDLPGAQPNILLIVLDTVRADMFSWSNTSPALSPNISRLAQRGVVFDQAWSTAPWTLPSQAGMFTGRLPHELSTEWLSPLDTSAPTLAEELASRGWHTAGFVGNTHYCSRETGLDRGFAHYDAYQLSISNMVLSTALGRAFLKSSIPVRFGFYDKPGRRPANDVVDATLDWLEQPRKRPYFVFMNFFDAHEPYCPPNGSSTKRPTNLLERLLFKNWWWVPKKGIPSELVGLLQSAYDDCVRELDAEVGRLFDELDRRGHLENTLVIVTADHGEHFGEHDLYLHGNSLFESLIHVPLVVVWPDKVPSGVRSHAPVSLIDLPATVNDLLGVEPAFPGVSWAQHWNQPRPPTVLARPLVSELASQGADPPCHGCSPVTGGAMCAVRDGMLKYILNGNGAEELYDLDSDPKEQRDLSAIPDYQPSLERLRRLARP